MQKLIKLSDTHYIIVDDSPIAEGDWVLTKENTYHQVDYVDSYTKINEWRKIIHSTQPLEFLPNDMTKDWVDYDKIKPLSLLEVEEAINGYSVEKMADDYCNEWQFERILGSGSNGLAYDSFVFGLNAHKELVKDKLFTFEDMEKCFKNGFLANDDVFASKEFAWIKYEKSLLPKTEWEIKEITPKGKIVLL